MISRCIDSGASGFLHEVWNKHEVNGFGKICHPVHPGLVKIRTRAGPGFEIFHPSGPGRAQEIFNFVICYYGRPENLVSDSQCHHVDVQRLL